MNILIITKEYYPSTSADSKRFTGISKYFAEQGHKVHVICDTHNAESFHENIVVTKAKKIGRDSLGMVERLISHSSFAFQTILRGRKLKSIDVVIATSPPLFNLYSGRVLAKKLNAKFVVDLRDIWPDVFAQTEILTTSSFIYKMFDKISYKSYKKSDMIAVVTPGKKELLVNKYPEFKSKIEFLSNGFNKEILDNKIDMDIEDKFRGKFNVIYTGKIGLAQDLTNLVKLAVDFKENNLLKFHLFGNGNGVNDIKELIEREELTNIEFYGYQSEEIVTTALRRSQIAYVSLGSEKLIDSIPTKMYEAMIFGCPILLSAKGDSVTLLDEFNYGKSSLPNDYDNLKNNFVFLMNNNNEYVSRAEEVKQGLLDKYSRDVVSKQYLDLLNKL